MRPPQRPPALGRAALSPSPWPAHVPSAHRGLGAGQHGHHLPGTPRPALLDGSLRWRAGGTGLWGPLTACRAVLRGCRLLLIGRKTISTFEASLGKGAASALILKNGPVSPTSGILK